MNRCRVAVAVSGGRDSMALLHCTARAAHAQFAAGSIEVWALHVNHGLQPAADEWSALVEQTCRRWAGRGLPLRFAACRLEGKPPRGDSVEAWARAGRYRELAVMARVARCAVVLLAHHRGDQAETFLLQALRGAGPSGLASMPASAERDGLLWERPWLEQPRAAIEAYVRRHRIRFVDDASNADPRFARNLLRAQVMPALSAAFPDAEARLAAAARQAALARSLIDGVANDDLAAVSDTESLQLVRWRKLSTDRRRESLRAWLSRRTGRGPTETLLARLMNELPATPPARWLLEGSELRRYRGRATVVVVTPRGVPELPSHSFSGAVGDHAVAGCGASLSVQEVAIGGMPLALLRDARWQPRRGGERFCRALGTPARSLKKQFQAAGVAPWSRDAPLLVAADGTLLFVPSLGADARALAAPGSPRVSLTWRSDR